MQLGLVTVVAVLIGGFAVIPGYGQANPTTIRISTPFESGGTPLCGGEDVIFSGRINTVLHTTVGPEGEFVYDVSHLNFQGVSGVTTISGTPVRIAEADTTIIHFRPSANEIISEVHGKLITQGNEGDNTLFDLTFHIIINANGEVTSFVENINTRCQG